MFIHYTAVPINNLPFSVDPPKRKWNPETSQNEHYFDRDVCRHLGSNKHRPNELKVVSLDYLLGVPKLRTPSGSVGSEDWRRSLRGHRAFPHSMVEPEGMPNPLSREHVEKYWGCDMDTFGDKSSPADHVTRIFRSQPRQEAPHATKRGHQRVTPGDGRALGISFTKRAICSI